MHFPKHPRPAVVPLTLFCVFHFTVSYHITTFAQASFSLGFEPTASGNNGMLIVLFRSGKARHKVYASKMN